MLPVKVRSEELSVHLGSYPSVEKGDRLDEASGTEAHEGGSASTQAVTRVKPEQAPKWRIVDAELPLDRRRLPGSLEEPTDESDPSTGVMGTACVQTVQQDTGDLARCEAGYARNDSSWSRPGQKSEGLVVPKKPGNTGGGKGPWFGVRLDEPRNGGLA